MLNDYRTICYSRIRAILQGWAPWVVIVRPANQVWLDSDSPNNPFPDAGDDTDFPRSALGMPDSNVSMFELEKTYAMGRYGSGTGFNPRTQPWTFTDTVTYSLTITHQDLRIKEANAANLETMRALMDAGPRLLRVNSVEQVDIGVREVLNVSNRTIISSNKVDEFGNPNGTMRLLTMFLIPVRFVKKGNVFVTP